MNQLIILGNGFDLAHGLKTSYMDFMLWYLNKVTHNVNTYGKYSDKLINIEKSKIQSYSAEVRSIEDFEKFISNNNIISYSKSILINKLIEFGIEKRWVDIEAIFYEILKIIFNLYKSGSRSTGEVLLPELNAALENLKYELHEYLMEIESNKKCQNNDIKTFLDRFNIINDVEKSGNSVYFLNFNYTSTIELYLKDFLPQTQLNYIHGKLGDKENPIIFGYGDETDEYYEEIEKLNINEFLTHFKSFGYFRTDNYQELMRYIESEPYQISIIGHSCGLSDRVMLKNIFENQNCESIKIYYYQRPDGSDNYIQLTQEMSRHFSNKHRMRTIIRDYKESEPLIKTKK